MKGILTIIISLFIFIPASYAKVVYVSSMKTALYKDADRKSVKVVKLKRGSRLTVLNQKGSWLNVKFATKKGWVSKIVTSTKRPGSKISLLGKAGTNARIHARKRASSDVTAASARGLMDEDNSNSGRTRAVNGRSDHYSREAVLDMERLFISEDNLLTFLQKERIQ